MVVLEGGGGVVTIGNNQYLQPDYLAPLPAAVSIIFNKFFDEKKNVRKKKFFEKKIFNLKKKYF